MRDVDSIGGLAAECHALHRYLTDAPASPYALEKYEAAHQEVSTLDAPLAPFDGWLLRAGFSQPLLMKLVQSYATVLAPTARIRQKAVLLLAILECSGDSMHVVQRSTPQSLAALLGRSALALFGFGLRLAGAIVVIAPVHVLTALRARFLPAQPLTRAVVGERP